MPIKTNGDPFVWPASCSKVDRKGDECRRYGIALGGRESVGTCKTTMFAQWNGRPEHQSLVATSARAGCVSTQRGNSRLCRHASREPGASELIWLLAMFLVCFFSFLLRMAS